MTTRTAELLPGSPDVTIVDTHTDGPVGKIRLDLGVLAVAIDLTHVHLEDGIADNQLCASVTATLDLPIISPRTIVDSSGCWEYGAWLDALDRWDWFS